MRTLRVGSLLGAASCATVFALAACEEDVPPSLSFDFDAGFEEFDASLPPVVDSAAPTDAAEDAAEDASLDAGADVYTHPVSCREVLARDPDAGSGAYLIDPDGPDAGQDDIAPFLAHCDMTYAEPDGSAGGWTLFFSLIVDGGAVPSTPSDSVMPGEPHYLPLAAAKALAEQSTQIHVRMPGTAGEDNEISFTSPPFEPPAPGGADDAGTYLHPIENLRVGRLLNWNIDPQEWIVVMKGDSMTPQTFIETALSFSQTGLSHPSTDDPGGCNDDGSACSYPFLYWSWGLGDGVEASASRGTWHRFNWGAGAMEFYAR
jgi:hypothetical protein